ncbi:MAG: multicopper oxidase family protein [Aeromonas sp.]
MLNLIPNFKWANDLTTTTCSHFPLDSGDEQDPSAQALRLPSGDYDYPLQISDRRFDAQGMLFYDQLNPDGVLGDKIVINGKIEPKMLVARRKYRLRLLNAGPSRFYSLAIVDGRNSKQSFSYIANDGNLLPAPLLGQKDVYLGVAERADIVVDFSLYPVGSELYLVNRLEQNSTRKPDKLLTVGVKILKFIVDREPGSVDLSRVPATLRPLPVLTSAQIAAAPIRRWVFARTGGLWTVNDQLFDVAKPVISLNKNSAEIWELVNPSGGWSHPIHIHLEEGRIIKFIQNGVVKPIPKHMAGRKDVYVLEPYTTLQIYLKFRDFTGKYVMHCHNLIHEDHAMMVRFDIKAT